MAIDIEAPGANEAALTAALRGLVGGVAQVVNTQTGALASATHVTIPFDDTTPQQTGEGTEYMTLAITPTNASSTLIIEVVAYLSISTAATWVIGALFQDATENALATGHFLVTTGTGAHPMVIRHKMTAGTTSATTFKFKAGANAGSGVMGFNGTSGVRKFGGTMASSITITEILP